MPDLNANASKIEWQVDDGYIDLLPEMKTDIMLSKGDSILIIDAKYYSHALQHILMFQLLIQGIYTRFLLMLRINKKKLKAKKYQGIFFMLRLMKNYIHQTVII